MVLKYSSFEQRISLSFSPGRIPTILIFLLGAIAFATSTIFIDGILGT